MRETGSDSPEPVAPARILVRIPNWLGDALMARPLFAALRRAHPWSDIRAVGPAPLLELLAADATFDGADAWPTGGRAREALASRLRAWHPDAALVLPPSFSSAWFAWRVGAAKRIGHCGEWRSALLTHALARPVRGAAHVADGYLELGAAIGATPVEVPLLGIAETARAGAETMIADASVRGRYAVLAPGALYGPAKRWPAERFATLGRAFEAKGWTPLVCGAATDRPLALAVAAAIGSTARTLAGRTTLTLQAALCAGARVVVSNDSGLAHLAAAVGAPTVAVFGSTSSAWTAPLGRRVRVVQRAPVCGPCFQRTCRIGVRCLTAITVDEVARACDMVAA